MNPREYKRDLGTIESAPLFFQASQLVSRAGPGLQTSALPSSPCPLSWEGPAGPLEPGAGAELSPRPTGALWFVRKDASMLSPP